MALTKESVAWFLQYRENLRRLSKCEKSREPIHSAHILSLPLITIAEMEIAELEILRNLQQFHFPEKLELLSKSVNSMQVKKSSCFRSLDPILVNGVLRVGGRLS